MFCYLNRLKTCILSVIGAILKTEILSFTNEIIFSNQVVYKTKKRAVMNSSFALYPYLLFSAFYPFYWSYFY